MNSTATKVKSLRMLPEDVKTLNEVVARFGMSDSQAIRYIIREWKRLSAQCSGESGGSNGTPHPADAA